MASTRRSLLPRYSPVVDRWDWQLAARCRDEDPAVFYGIDGEHRRTKEQRQQRAKSICAQCTVATECRRHAEKFQEQYGVWGGLTEADRGHVDLRKR